jgi:transketolase
MLDEEAGLSLAAEAGGYLHDLARSLHGGQGAAEAACLAPIVAALFARYLRFDAADTTWPDRDRVLLGGSATGLAERLSGLLGAAPGLTEIFAHAPGLSLGAGLGAALAERALAARFGRSLVDHRIWVVLDGLELSLGPAQEAALLAGSMSVGRLTLIASCPTEHWTGLGRFTAMGWTLRRVEAGNPNAACAALSAAMRSRKPTLIACRQAGAAPSQGPGADGEMAWSAVGQRGATARRAWLKRLKNHAGREDFERIATARPPMAVATPEDATASGIGQTVEAALAALTLPDLAPPGYAHATGAALLGMALHGGARTVGRHTLAESDALRPGMRVAADQGLSIVHVLAEPNGRCGNPAARAAWRAMENVHVFRPADRTEALACLDLALRRPAGPSVVLVADGGPGPAISACAQGCARGGYILADTKGPRALTIIASGPEVWVALEAAEILQGLDISTAVVSLPCWELFAAQDGAYRAGVLGAAPRLGLEAGGGFGWERHLGPDGVFLGSVDGDIDAARAVAAARSLLRGAMRRAVAT